MIELVNLCKTLGNFHLSNINLNIKKNEYFVILGPTGTGKTVILETIAGLYHPDKGEILFKRKNINKISPEDRNIGFVYQEYALFPHLNVKDNIIFGLKLRKISQCEIDKKLKDVSELLSIDHLLNRYPSTLSGGEQQRVAIARILVIKPEILLLDEPLSALDPRTKENFIKELKKIHKNFNTTTLHITHDFNEALALADRIGVMKDGKIIQVGTPDEIFYEPQNDFIANFIGIENIYEAVVKDEDGVSELQIGNIKLKAKTSLKGKVSTIIPPEEIILSKENFKTSAQNSLKCNVKNIYKEGKLIKVEMKCENLLIKALITKYALKDLDISIGSKIFAIFKTTSVKVYKTS